MIRLPSTTFSLLFASLLLGVPMICSPSAESANKRGPAVKAPERGPAPAGAVSADAGRIKLQTTPASAPLSPERAAQAIASNTAAP